LHEDFADTTASRESEGDRRFREFIDGPWTEEHEDLWRVYDLWIPPEDCSGDGCVLYPQTDERLVAIVPKLSTNGIYEPGHMKKGWDKKRYPTYDWRKFPLTKENTALGWDRGETLPLIEALNRQWYSEAMMLSYLVRHRATGRALAYQPRVNKNGLPWMEKQGYDLFSTMLGIDVDTPGHRAWTPEDQEEFERVTMTSPLLQRAGIYRTERGWRALFIYAEPVPTRYAEEVGNCFIVQLQREGVRADTSCKDWTRLFRLPKTVRFSKDGKRRIARRSDFVPDLSKMVPIDPYDPAIYTSSSLPRMNTAHVPPADSAEESTTEDAADSGAGAGGVGAGKAASEQPKEKKAKKKAEPRYTGDIHFADAKDLPKHYDILVDVVARAVHEKVSAGYHHMYLFLSGMLCFERIPYEFIPAIIKRIATKAEQLWRKTNPADSRTWVDEHERSAIDTCLRHASGARVGGYGKLASEYPGIVDAVKRGLGRSAFQQATTQAPIEDGRKDMLNRILALATVDGTALIKSGCGVGKTHAAEITATIRANSGLIGMRAPPGSKTVISVDKNRLAKQVVQHLVARGAMWKRYRSPLSVIDEGGNPVCKFYGAGKLLQAGGHSVHYELCEGRGQKPCEYKSKSKAYGQFEGDEDARIVVGNHWLIKPMMRSVGATGFTIIDEPQQLLETVEITPREILAVFETEYAYVRRYFDCMKAAILAFSRWMERAKLNEEYHHIPIAESMMTVLAEGGLLVTEDELRVSCAAAMVTCDRDRSPGELILDCVRQALLEDHKGTTPLTKKSEMLRARSNEGLAAQIGMASKVMKVLYEAVVERIDEDPRSLKQTVRIEEVYNQKTRETYRIAKITGARKQIVEALREPGPHVLLDANAELHLPVLKRVMFQRQTVTIGDSVYEQDRPFLPPLYPIQAGDRCRVDRYMAPLPYSSRAGWMVGGKLLPKYVAAAVERALLYVSRPDVCDFLEKEPKDRSLCIISFKRVAAALRATRNPESEKILRAWHEMGGTDEQLAAFRAELGPMLKRWTGEMIFGHYFGLRGMNDAERADTFVTLGDPWPSIGEARNEVAFLNSYHDDPFEGPGVATTLMDAEERSLALCQAEAEQAHGRARAPERSTPCLALHVGRVRPGGAMWAKEGVTELEVPPGRRAQPAAMRAEEFREIRQMLCMTQKEVSERIGVSISKVENYESGRTNIPPAVADAIRDLLQ